MHFDSHLRPAEKFLGLSEGDAHVIRNAGGRFADAHRSLTISQTLLGTKEVAFVHHTDCGMLTFNDDVIRKIISDKGGNADAIAFQSFTDLEKSVKDDIAAYKKNDLLLQDIPVRGFVYDVKTGALTEVKA